MCVIPLVFVLLAAPARDTTLTLAEARARVLEANPLHRAARSAANAATRAAARSGSAPDPILAVAREQTGSSVWQNTVTIEQALEVFGQGSRRGEAGRARALIAQRELDATARLLRARVTAAYAQVRAADEIARLGTLRAAAFEHARRMVEARRAAGDASGYETRRLGLEAARAEAEGAESERRRREAHGELAVLLALDARTTFRLPDTIAVAATPVAADSLLRLAAERDVELQVALASADAARAHAAQLRRERLPVPSLVLGYKEERSGGAANLTGYTAAISFPLPLWGGRGAAAAAGAAESERRAALADEAAGQAHRRVLGLADAVNALAIRLAAVQARLGEEARLALAAADALFAEGEMSLPEWLDGVAAFHDAAVLQASLTAEYVARLAELERVTGLPLPGRSS